MFKGEGTWVNLWLVHVDVWQKPTQYYKAIILQLKIKKHFKTGVPTLGLCVPAGRAIMGAFCCCLLVLSTCL